MSGGRRRASRVALGAVAAIGALAVLRPWTIRPIATSAVEAFDADSFAASAWPRVLSEADAAALDVAAAARAQSDDSSPGEGPAARRSVFVRGSGVVVDVDLRSRIGLARVRIGGGSSPAEVAIQVGPVLHGTALRDALSFVSFTDFANQSEFAAVATALNDRVLRSVLAPLDTAALPGRVVSFTGATALAGARPDATLEIIPLTLDVAGEDD